MARPRSTSDPLGVLDIGYARSDYEMANRSKAQSRSRRGVPSQGAGADYHYRNDSDWLWMYELAWEIYRNHLVVGSIVDRAVEYMLQDGFSYDPDTGDRKVDRDLKDWWDEECYEEEHCDPAGEDTFIDQTEIVLRSALVGGDMLGRPIDDAYGSVGLVEGHMCRSPSRSAVPDSKVVLGIQFDRLTRRRQNFWLLDEPISQFDTISTKTVTPTPAYYYDELTQRDERNMFHVRFAKRSTQTRGVTAFSPLFTPADYLNDIEYLELVHKRAASLFAWVRSRSERFDPKYLAAELALGKDVTDEKARDAVEASHRQFKEVAPGTELVALPGETIEMSSANIPNPEHFPFVKMLLTYIGINLGMPLVMVLMDASETNYSGIRGAIDMARNGFRRNQRRLMTRWHCPVNRWKILKYAERDRYIRALVEKSLRRDSQESVAKYDPEKDLERKERRRQFNIFRHWWNPPSWPYIDPPKDAAADLIRETSMQSSPRRVRHERGLEWNQIVRETVADRALAIRTALKAAKKINTEFKLEGGDVVRWRDLAPLPVAERVNVQVRDNLDQPNEPEPNEPGKKQQPQEADDERD
ncbi:MAG: phage portal protein [Pirellulales bacterium]